MTLAKKGRRKICVKGVQYHWRVMRKTDKDLAQAYSYYNKPLLYFVVEIDSMPSGSLLICESGFLLKDDQITPRKVEAAIQSALETGWNPHQPGKPFVLKMAANHDETQPKSWESGFTFHDWTAHDLVAFEKSKLIQHQLLDEEIITVELRLLGNWYRSFSEIWEYKGLKLDPYEGGVYARHGDYFKISRTEFQNINENPYVVKMIDVKQIVHCESLFTLFSMAYRFLSLEQNGYVVFNDQYNFCCPEDLSGFSNTYLLKRFPKETLENHRLIKFESVAF